MIKKIKLKIKKNEVGCFKGIRLQSKSQGMLSAKRIIMLAFNLTFLFFICFFIACGKKSSDKIDASQQVTPRPKPKIPEYVPPVPPKKYTYKGGAYRDPLIPGGGSSAYSISGLSSEGTEILTNEKLATLQIKGIFKDDKTGGIAIISDTTGSSYILKEGKLFDRKHRIIKGVAGTIGKNSVTLFSNDMKIELKLKKTGEDKNADKK
ncbi:MAG: hypothetical protein PHE88_09435 [Elusimicrobia bacterium]|nr:hypothetical protein [Elusimicrobiota bacterium]